MDCFYCLSLWAAAGFAIVIGQSWRERFMLWPALSAGAIFLERLPVRGAVPPPRYDEDPEKNDVLRTR